MPIAMLCGLLFLACGSAGATSDVASCSIVRSSLGPFSPETALGSSMSEDEARARMAADSIVGWLAVSAAGPWDLAWEEATSELGNGIHSDLTWLDVDGQLLGLYEPNDSYDFNDLRVSRSFQGKIEHSDDPIYLPIPDSGQEISVDAECVISVVGVGDAANDMLLDVTASAS